MISEIITIVWRTAPPAKTKSIPAERRNYAPLSMAIEKVLVMQECPSKHLRMRTAIMKKDKKQDEEKQERVKMERSYVDTK